MSPAVAAPHPRTLLGAARAMLQPPSEAQDLHLQAQAACLLGDYPRARQLWELLAQQGKYYQLYTGNFAEETA